MRGLVLVAIVGGLGLLALLATRERGAGGEAQAQQRLEERATGEAEAGAERATEVRLEGVVGRAPAAEPSTGRVESVRLVTLAGRVLDEHGDALEGVSVSARKEPRSSDPAPAEQRTDPEGRFRFTGLAAGVWWLEVDSSELAAGARCSVDSSAGDVEAELRVQRGHTLVLRVRWADGSPVQSIEAIIPELGAEHMEREAFPRPLAGEFELRGVKEGDHLVRVGAKREGCDVDAVQYVTVPASEPIEFVLRVPDLVLRGTVLDVDGNPLEGATIGTDRRGLNARVAPDGSFELRGLVPGHTWVTASAPGHHCEPLGVDMRAGHPEVQLVLVRMARIRGRVVDPSGQPFFGAQIADGLERGANDASSDREGRFELHLPPGSCVLRAVGNGHADSEDLQLTLAPGEQLDGFEFRLRTACRVVGRVLDADGHPVQEAYVYALYQGLLTADDGSFAFETCPPDPVRIDAVDDDCRVWIEVTPTPDAPTSVELRFERRDPVLLHVGVTRGAEPLRASLFLRSGSFWREGPLDSAGRLSVELQRPGRWSVLVTLEGARHFPADLASIRRVDFTVPDLESWSLELDWNALTQPLDIWGVWSLLYD